MNTNSRHTRPSRPPTTTIRKCQPEPIPPNSQSAAAAVPQVEERGGPQAERRNRGRLPLTQPLERAQAQRPQPCPQRQEDPLFSVSQAAWPCPAGRDEDDEGGVGPGAGGGAAQGGEGAGCAEQVRIICGHEISRARESESAL